MQNNQEKIYIGWLAYGGSTAKYLPYFLPSLMTQTYQNFELLILDNSHTEENENTKYLRENYPEIKTKWAGGNIGFARGFNLLINEV